MQTDMNVGMVQVVEERASLRSQLFRVSALYHMRQELHKLNIPLVGLVVDDVDMDCAPVSLDPYDLEEAVV